MKAQGAIEYLLILVAVMGLIGGVLLMLNSVLTAPAAQRDLQLDIIECSEDHIWLKDYTTSYNGNETTAPGSISYYQAGIMEQNKIVPEEQVTGETVCQLQGKYKLNFSKNPQNMKAWLQTDNGWLEYGTEQIIMFLTNPNANADAPECGGVNTVVETQFGESTTLTFESPGAGFSGGTGTLHIYFSTATGTITVEDEDVTGTGPFTKELSIPAGDNPVQVTIDATSGWAKVCGKEATQNEPYIEIV